SPIRSVETPSLPYPSREPEVITHERKTLHEQRREVLSVCAPADIRQRRPRLVEQRIDERRLLSQRAERREERVDRLVRRGADRHEGSPRRSFQWERNGRASWRSDFPDERHAGHL